MKKLTKEDLKPGTRVTVNGGFPGSVVRENPPGMYEVRVARGLVCVDPSDIKLAKGAS